MKFIYDNSVSLVSDKFSFQGLKPWIRPQNSEKVYLCCCECADKKATFKTENGNAKVILQIKEDGNCYAINMCV